MESVTSLIENVTKLTGELEYQIHQRTILARALDESKKEYGAQIGIQLNLKEKIHLLQKDIESNKRTIAFVEETNESQRKEVSNLLRLNDDMQCELEQSKIATSISEARTTDLQDALRIERSRFDRALDFERESDRGLRVRSGLLPKEGGQSEAKVEPVSKGRVPWNQQAGRLQKESKKHADEIESKWKSKIAEVEAEDARRDGNRTADSTEEASNEVSARDGSDEVGDDFRRISGTAE